MTHRNSHFFGRQLIKQIEGRESVFRNEKSAENYFQQIRQFFSSEGEQGGRGYAGEILTEIMLHLPPESDASLTDIAGCKDLKELRLLISKGREFGC